MTFDHSKLRGRMVEKFGSVSAVADQLGITPATMSSRLRNQTQFKASEIMMLCASQCLDIPKAEVITYFFTEKVR